MELKKCNRCSEQKSLDLFFTGRAVCKKCVQEYKRTYNKKFYEINIEKIRHRRKTPAGKFSEYKGNAHSAGRPFELTFEEFSKFWGQECFYCGDRIETIGLDRVDSSVGYVLKNVVSCCATCNEAKMDKTQEEFIQHCRKVVANLSYRRLTETMRQY